MSQRPVWYIARMLPSYRIPILERLNEALGGRLVVFHGAPPGRSSLNTLTKRSAHAFETVRLKNRWLAGQTVHLQNINAVFQRRPLPAAIIAEESPRSLTLPVLMQQARWRGIPVILWGHFSSNSRAFSAGNLLDRYRLFLARRADACLCYTEDIAELLRPHIPPEKLLVARNTLDIDQHHVWRSSLEEQGRMSVRKRLGLPTDALVLSFIGRLDAVKGTEKLIPILTALSNRRRVSLVVIGDGPDRISLESSTRSDSLVMTGALAPEMAAPWLYAADIMVLPGQVGLAVNHAFAYGLPVVVRDSPHSGRYHSPEIQFVRNGSNAEVAVGGSVDAFIEAIERVALDLDRYSQNALRAAETELSPEIMIDGMLAAIREVERLD